MTFEEFFPTYLDAHRDPRTRAVHAAGLIGALGIAAGAAIARKPAWLLAALASGYLPAFASHWLFEKNQPKTFESPESALLSIRGDFTMTYLLLTGRSPTA